MVFDMEGYHSKSHGKERSDRTVTSGPHSLLSDSSDSEDLTPGPSRVCLYVHIIVLNPHPFRIQALQAQSLLEGFHSLGQRPNPHRISRIMSCQFIIMLCHRHPRVMVLRCMHVESEPLLTRQR